MMAIIFMMKIGNNNRNPSIHRKNVCVGITVLYMYKNVSLRHILSMSDGAKDCWRRKNTTNITMNISICTLLPFLFDLVLMHRRLHRGTSGKDRDMDLDETENRTNEASDLSQKKIIFLCLFSCVNFFIKHTMVS